MLLRKQSSRNEDWLKTFANISQLVSKQQIDQEIEKVIEDIKAKTKGKRVAVAWSGGKDSIALEFITRQAGIRDVFGVFCELEYPAMMNWVMENKPEGCELVNTGQDLRFLKEHESWLFPRDAHGRMRWFQAVQHQGQNEYFKRRKMDMLILGRRRKEGNHCGRDNIYHTRQGVVRYCPLADWPHEYILAVIYYYNLKLPPLYDWENGFVIGTHPWPARPDTKDIWDGWDKIWRVDPLIVFEAATAIKSAEQYIKGYQGRHETQWKLR